MRPYFFAVAVFAALLPLAAQAQPVVQSQEGIALENQILQLQQQVQQLQSNGGGNGGSALGGGQALPPPSSGVGGAPDGGMVASLLNQVSQLQTQVEKLRGDVDTLQNQVSTQNAQTQQEIGDLKFQMSNGQGAQAQPGQGPAPGPESAPPGPPPAQATRPNPPPPNAAASSSPRVLLHTAQHAFAQRDFAGAEAASRAILAHAGSSPEAYPAQFLLAQSLAAEGRPQDAAIAYDNTYNLNRAGAEAPASLLGLARSLAAIHQNQAACETLSSLNSQFPSLPDGMAQRVEAVRHLARCS
ncbi:tetratricopeptide repeat protein [Acidocella sp.]|jgi:TolA-binding protein|uniref:tetratricopeptide repeat protein n=1 Tax=Acidocella sp. TaxID=50710 RepID=UPI002F3F5C42